MKKNGTLILAQVDHLTGEELGFAIDQIVSWGAHNVYVFPGITKKNRSGCVLLIDIDPNEETKWAKLLAEELSIYGYHRILSSHYCSRCKTEIRKAVLRKGRACLRTTLHFKMSQGSKGPGRVEHADLVRIHEQIKEELRINVSLSKLRTQLESQSMRMTNPIEIDL